MREFQSERGRHRYYNSLSGEQKYDAFNEILFDSSYVVFLGGAGVSTETGILVGTIVSSQADEKILTDGKVDLDKMQPIMFDISSVTYRVIGPVVGKAFHDGLQLK